MIDNSVKNRNQSTKILLHSFEDPSGEWEADGDDWYRWALPVYRMPQGSWAETTGFTRQKIWFIEKVFSEDPTNPNDIDFPTWVACYWDSQAGRWVVIKSGGGESLPPTEPNPGVVTVEITGQSDCDGLNFDALGYHVFLSTITSRPFGSPTEMRREDSGQLTIFDPTGCMLDLEYDPEDFIGATAFVSLMYGGEIFDQTYNFKGGSVAADDEVLVGDAFETFRPSDSCKPFGWVGGERTGYTASIGPVVPNGNTTFQVRLPERGLYEVEITYGDASDPTKNLVTLLDGDIELATFTGESEEGETWVVKDEYTFRSTNRPLLKVNLNNADDYDTRIVKLVIKQLDPPTQWEVVNRCCIAKDTE